MAVQIDGPDGTTRTLTYHMSVNGVRQNSDKAENELARTRVEVEKRLQLSQQQDCKAIRQRVSLEATMKPRQRLEQRQ